MLQLRRADQADGDQVGTAELDFASWAKGAAQGPASSRAKTALGVATTPLGGYDSLNQTSCL
jgi:hypothetical protein